MAYIETDGAVNVGGSTGTCYPVYPYGYGYGNNNGFLGGDGIWAIILVALIFGWGRNGWGGNGQDTASMINDINTNTNSEFNQLTTTNGINSIQNALSSAQVERCNSTTELLQAINGMNSNFNQCLTKNKKPIKFFATNKIAVGTCA